MASLLAELKRRNVYKVAFAYLILGWLVLQITDVVAPALRLPDWTMSLVTYLGLIGFPFALLFTWAFELTPTGLKRTAEVDPKQSITSKTGQTLNGAIITMLVLAVAVLLTDKFYLAEAPRVIADRGAETETHTATDDAPGDEANGKPRSIAVLPFVNMSNDPDQEYFSDGISEELLNGLAKISELQVAARTSSFAFKGQNTDITDIGRALKVETVLEGSVRKAGQRVRITAQLINVDDGYHLWSEVYDRELDDIFAIQDEISKAIVEALKVHLTDQEAVSATAAREVNLDAYNTVLLARHNLRQRNQETIERASFLFQKAIDIDPGYADAWAGKATAVALLSVEHYGELSPGEANRQAQQIIDMALRLEPDNAEALATQALIDLNTKDPTTALASIERAVAANPSSGIMQSWRADALDRLGDYPAADAAMTRAYRLDPLHGTIRRNRALMYALTGKTSLAREILIPGERDYYEISATIGRAEGDLAAAEQALTEGINAFKGGDSERLRTSRHYFHYFWLGSAATAYDGASQDVEIVLDAYLNPERALETITSLPADEYGELAFQSHLAALEHLGRFSELIEVYESQHGKPDAIAGSTWSPVSRLEWLIVYTNALKASKQEDAFTRLSIALQDYMENAETSDAPATSAARKARIALLHEDPQGAIAALKVGLQYNALTTDVFTGPYFDSLRDYPEFLAIQEAWLQHVNSERAKLDWPPLELASL